MKDIILDQTLLTKTWLTYDTVIILYSHYTLILFMILLFCVITVRLFVCVIISRTYIILLMGHLPVFLVLYISILESLQKVKTTLMYNFLQYCVK